LGGRGWEPTVDLPRYQSNQVKDILDSFRRPGRTPRFEKAAGGRAGIRVLPKTPFAGCPKPIRDGIENGIR